MATQTNTITHLAGPCVVISGRAIQRCAICGQKLADSKGQDGPVGPNGEPPRFNAWAEKAFVQVESGNLTRYSVIGSLNDDKKNFPEDFCEQWE